MSSWATTSALLLVVCLVHKELEIVVWSPELSVWFIGILCSSFGLKTKAESWVQKANLCWGGYFPLLLSGSRNHVFWPREYITGGQKTLYVFYNLIPVPQGPALQCSLYHNWIFGRPFHPDTRPAAFKTCQIAWKDHSILWAHCFVL